MSGPEIKRTPASEPYWRALSEGRLDHQHCPACGASWLPARAQCPSCLSADTEWRPSSGRGRVVSWIVYRKAYAPHLEARLPYSVAIVELAEGPRILTNIVDSPDGHGLSEGCDVVLAIEEDYGLSLPRFRLGRPSDRA